MRIAHDRVACVELLLPVHPTPTEQYAADELQYYLELMTCAAFRQTVELHGPVIAVGRAAEGLGLSDDGLGSLVVDQQSMETTEYSYMMAHGMGVPVVAVLSV